MRKKRYFTAAEITIWLVSVSVIVVTFLIFDRSNYLSLFGSLVGVTAIIFCAKGNPIGQIMMLCFAVFYGIISISFRYYGEMITYLGMSAPMAVFSLISWVRHPYSKSEVRGKRPPCPRRRFACDSRYGGNDSVLFHPSRARQRKLDSQHDLGNYEFRRGIPHRPPQSVLRACIRA